MKCAFEKVYKYIKHKEVYAVIYKDLGIILYNTNFSGDTKIFLLSPIKDGKEKPHAEVPQKNRRLQRSQKTPANG